MVPFTVRKKVVYSAAWEISSTETEFRAGGKFQEAGGRRGGGRFITTFPAFPH
jgi:hypothetical protein